MTETTLERRPHLLPCIIAAVMLLVALGDWPYAYYQLLRFVVCGASVYVVFVASTWTKLWAMGMFGIVAVLFNPLIPIHLSQEIRQMTDFICALLFAGAAFILKEPLES
ncbi:DUF6804 family protein [Planctomycetota bacterium]